MTKPVPEASTAPVPPPAANIAYFGPDGKMTPVGNNFFTQLWAALQGGGGASDKIKTLQDEVATIFAMHGDATLATDGTITVVSSDGRAFVESAFTDTTDASNITSGTLDPARIADDSLPQAKITDLSTPVAVASLGTPTAGLRKFVSDSNVTASGNFGAIVAGGGSNVVPVFADGSQWRLG